MASLPTGRNGRILAASLAVLALLVVWIGVIEPVLDWYGSRAGELTALRLRAARETALIGTLPSLRKVAAEASRTPTKGVLTGATDAIAGATLQEQVKSMASAVKADLNSVETLPAEQTGQYRRIGVRVELNAQLPIIVALLKSVEDAQPSMLVDDLRLTSQVSMPNVVLPLDCSFTVYGFRVGTAKESPP
jgi:hypothetical protein